MKDKIFLSIMVVLTFCWVGGAIYDVVKNPPKRQECVKREMVTKKRWNYRWSWAWGKYKWFYEETTKEECVEYKTID